MLSLLDELETAIERAVTRFDDGSPAGEQLRYHFGFGEASRRGKRLRSRLVIEVAAEEGVRAAEVIDAAVAIEMVHEFSLIHDDIEDGDTMRRGRATTWNHFGLAHGVNAGDALCAMAYLSLLDAAAGKDAARVAAQTETLLRAHVEMTAGQARDISFEIAAYVAMDEYHTMIAGKTGALFGAACALGALGAGSGRERAEAYSALGRAYGMAFQIEDDVLGIWGEPALTGKPAGADLAKRKWTFPIVWSLAQPGGVERETIAAAYGSVRELDTAAVARVVAALDALGAREAAMHAASSALTGADALAAAHGIDRSGRVRAFFSNAMRRSA